MQTRQATYVDFLGTPDVQMAVPVFQRIYTWSPWQCQELLGDIMTAGEREATHFIGSIVYTREQDEDGSEVYSIIDGQQRTTTVMLLFVALRDYLAEHGPHGDLTAASISERYLTITRAGSTVGKFDAAPVDKATFDHLTSGSPLPEQYKVSKRVLDNYQYFRDQLEAGIDLDVLMRGLQELFAIIVELDETDDAQLIFEGLNAKGMPLETSDLLRNKLFYGTEESEEDQLLEDYWEPLEALFAQDDDQSIFNAALRCWLVGKCPEAKEYSRYELYGGFRKYLAEQYPGTPEDLMQELLQSCTVFRKFIATPAMKKHLEWARGEVSAEQRKAAGTSAMSNLSHFH